MKLLLLFLCISLLGCGDIQQRQVDIARIESEERLEMARLKIVEKYFHEMDRQEKILEVAKILDIGKKKEKSK